MANNPNLIQRYAQDELRKYQDQPEGILVKISYFLKDSDPSKIRYWFFEPDSVRRAEEMIDLYPLNDNYKDRYGYINLPASHPYVNAIMNTPFFNFDPLILYVDYFGKHIVYDNIQTIFDLLGALHTYYEENPNAFLRQNTKLQHLRKFENGYMLSVWDGY